MTISSRNKWLLYVFGAYVLSIAIFATIYFEIYRSDPRSFTFASAIVPSQKQFAKTKMAGEVRLLTEEIVALRQLEQLLRTGAPNVTRTLESGGLIIAASVTSGAGTFTVLWPKARGGGFPGYVPPPPTTLRIQSPHRSPFVVRGRSSYDLPENDTEFLRLSEVWLMDKEYELGQLNVALASLDTDFPHIWNEVDFIYFSAITQCTVGYGDILPNSTAVRVVVTIQTLVAVALLGLAINLQWPRRRATTQRRIRNEARRVPGTGSE